MKKSAHLLVDDEHWGDFIKGDSEDFQAYKIKWIAWFEIKLRLVFALWTRNCPEKLNSFFMMKPCLIFSILLLAPLGKQLAPGIKELGFSMKELLKTKPFSFFSPL